MIIHKVESVNKSRNGHLVSYTRGTPHSIARRILDHLYEDLREKKITALLLIEISRDIKKSIYRVTGKED